VQKKIVGEDGEIAVGRGVAGETAIDAAIVRVADAIEARGSVTGSERSRMPWISVKIAVLAPMPSASVTIAVSVNPGDLRNCRSA